MQYNRQCVLKHAIAGKTLGLCVLMQNTHTKIWDNKKISNSSSSVWDPADGTTRKTNTTLFKVTIAEANCMMGEIWKCSTTALNPTQIQR